MSTITDLIGTSANAFRVALGGFLLKNNSGNVIIRNTGDTADAELTASKVNVSGNAIELNSDAAGTSADWKYTLQRPSSGMTSAVTLTLPTDDGSPSQVLQTDGSGSLSWVSLAGTSEKISCDTTSLAFGSTSPITLFTLPANAVIRCVRVIVDTAFNGTPSLSVGIAGTTSKYLSSTQVDLTYPAQTVFEAYPGRASVGTTEALIATYASGGATAGAARIEIEYVVPS